MNIDIDRYVEIERGSYSIGVCKDIIEKMSKKIGCADIKREFLYNSYPLHDVEIEGCQIAKRLVTLSEFERFVDESGYLTDAERDGWGWTWEDRWIKRRDVYWKAPFHGKADDIYYKNKNIIPVLQVSWNDAIAYCGWLSMKANCVRLLYEREWEVFAQVSSFAGMGDIDSNNNRKLYNCKVDYLKDLISMINSNPEDHYPGMLWEWNYDWFDIYPNGISNKEYGTVYKVLRGGSLQSYAVQRTREYRFRRCPSARSPFYGFRIVIA
ncbi:MAG: SUMF1/EgtB/PvdO family nonheme iron enzyme [Spirochaetota bacterium]|nr:SUMF1/EgtB/PvdO family nonheme iron enzyme [Spirochaetota bacterium]